MDQLELLKKDWKNQESSLPKVSKEEISRLIHKRSSSIVKWIFIISVLEFIIPYLTLLFTGYDNKSMSSYEKIGLSNFMTIFYVITSIIILYFIFLFYKNYRSISASSNPKKLMQNIIKTRNIVKYYIWFNLIALFVVSLIVMYKMFNSQVFMDSLPENTNMVMIWLVSIVVIVILVVFLWLFYRLIYGTLLTKLKHNYKELVSNGVDKL